MQVILKRKWFVGGNRYKSVGKSPVEIPDKFRAIVPKGAVVVDEPGDAPLKFRKEDASVEVPKEDAPEKYVNPAHALDSGRQFVEAFSDVNSNAREDVKEQKEVDTLRDKFKNKKDKGK